MSKDKIIYQEMSNSDIKLRIETLKNLFESKKNKIIKLCEEMNDIEKEYFEAQHEMDVRKNLYL